EHYPRHRVLRGRHVPKFLPLGRAILDIQSALQSLLGTFTSGTGNTGDWIGVYVSYRVRIDGVGRSNLAFGAFALTTLVARYCQTRTTDIHHVSPAIRVGAF